MLAFMVIFLFSFLFCPLSLRVSGGVREGGLLNLHALLAYFKRGGKAGGLLLACADRTNKKLPSHRLNDFVREQLTKLGRSLRLWGH